MSSFKRPPPTSFKDLTPVPNSDSQHHSTNPSNQGSSFASIDLTLVTISDSQHHLANRSNRGSSSASIGNLQSLNLIDNSLSENFDQIHDQEKWEKYRKWAATCVAIYASYAVSLVSILHCRDHIKKSISEQGDYERYVLIKRLTTLEDADCRSQLRMSKDAFATLVSMLKRTQFLRDNPQSKVEEQVAKFLHIIGNNLRNCTIKFFYRQSGETISLHFHQVLKAIISLEDIFLKQPDGFNCPPEIRHNPKYWPYFKLCSSSDMFYGIFECKWKVTKNTQ
ncbi:hypothetical protein ACSBR2_021603 [Camellia fascicularis]